MSAAAPVHAPPHDHKITPRDVTFNITDQSPKYWFGNDPFKTHFFNAFFTTFPPGEDFFVRSVIYYRSQINDAKLQQEITDFSTQEGHHSRCHQDHMDVLTRQGYTSLVRENKIIDTLGKWSNRRFPLTSLLLTLALEHFTALLAHQALMEPERFSEPAHEDFLPLFKWHAAEEIEHKAVAYDVYMKIDGRYWPRVFAMIGATLGLLLILPIRMTPLLFKDKVLFKWSTWRNGLPFLFGKNGLFTKPWRHYLMFYRRDFHPWDVQDYQLIADLQKIYEQGDLLTIGKNRTAAMA
ncbi:MAG TPA: metal-dependent hydrolase [Pseudomonadales bacterium]|nr:metal-dependent hydrolase [Pseudomonadales bacterium]